MPTNIQHEVEDAFPLTSGEVEDLWKHVIAIRDSADDEVTVRCVSEKEMRKLNLEYRKKDYATNVLTFTYDAEHDIALCLSVAGKEAAERGVAMREYVALLLVHAFLHAVGMDHERSAKEAADTEDLENEILERAGFEPASL